MTQCENTIVLYCMRLNAVEVNGKTAGWSSAAGTTTMPDEFVVVAGGLPVRTSWRLRLRGGGEFYSVSQNHWFCR